MRATIKNPPNDDVENVPPPPPRVTTTTKPLPRLVSRDRIFSQSSNQVRVQHKNDTRIFWLLIRYDWFHVFLRGSLFKSIILLLAIWTGMILAWASIYKAIDDNHPGKNCGLGAPPETISFHGAFAFSLETCKFSLSLVLEPLSLFLESLPQLFAHYITSFAHHSIPCRYILYLYLTQQAPRLDTAFQTERMPFSS